MSLPLFDLWLEAGHLYCGPVTAASESLSVSLVRAACTKGPSFSGLPIQGGAMHPVCQKRLSNKTWRSKKGGTRLFGEGGPTRPLNTNRRSLYNIRGPLNCPSTRLGAP